MHNLLGAIVCFLMLPLVSWGATGWEPAVLKQIASDGTEIRPFTILDYTGIDKIDLYGELAIEPVCAAINLEVEMVPAHRPFTGVPTDIGSEIGRCSLQPCPKAPPTIRLDLRKFTTGRAYKWQARIHRRQYFITYDDGVLKCERTPFNAWSDWVQFNAISPYAFAIPAVWRRHFARASGEHIFVGKCSPPCEGEDMERADDIYFNVQSVENGGIQTIRFGGNIRIPHVDGVKEGELLYRVKSSHTCEHVLTLSVADPNGTGKFFPLTILQGQPVRTSPQWFRFELPQDLRSVVTEVFSDQRRGYVNLMVECRANRPFVYSADAFMLLYDALEAIKQSD